MNVPLLVQTTTLFSVWFGGPAYAKLHELSKAGEIEARYSGIQRS